MKTAISKYNLRFIHALNFCGFRKQDVILHLLKTLHQKRMNKDIIDRLNELGSSGKPFLFVVDYKGDKAYIKKLSEIDVGECLYDFGSHTNAVGGCASQLPAEIEWEVDAPKYDEYERSFNIVKNNMLAGNSYLANLTCQVAVRCNLSLEDIFRHSKGKYKLLLNNPSDDIGRFVCFSPETFVKISGGRIYSYPMKGTIDAALPDAEQVLMDDRKEAAEHATIVDLIRNDLNTVATDVKVEKFRFVDVLHTNKGDILQTSSEISGKLPSDYTQRIGDILAAQLPAGSITGAPKKKTCQIIDEAETYERGFYTGIMGIYTGGELDSAVMIRFIEQTDEGMFFKAGGGITSQSQCMKEYEEVLQKVYLPITK